MNKSYAANNSEFEKLNEQLLEEEILFTLRGLDRAFDRYMSTLYAIEQAALTVFPASEEIHKKTNKKSR
ncbi:MAG TPA: hypothetical protein PKY53_05230 [Clostridia bacterium]|jgi:hypothetical protein|nr:hypothetical protein [Clostridia bacterium]